MQSKFTILLGFRICLVQILMMWISWACGKYLLGSSTQSTEFSAWHVLSQRKQTSLNTVISIGCAISAGCSKRVTYACKSHHTVVKTEYWTELETRARDCTGLGWEFHHPGTSLKKDLRG